MSSKKGARGVKDAERLSMGGLTACPNYSIRRAENATYSTC